MAGVDGLRIGGGVAETRCFTRLRAVALSLATAALSAAVAWFFLSPRSPAAPRIEFFLTGGIDGNLDGCDKCFGYPDAGLVKLGAYLDRRDRSRSILADAGDAWEAGADPSLARELIGAFTDLGYDSAALGDQEFSNGLDFLLAAREVLPVLGSVNLSWEGHSLAPSGPGIFRRHGFSILVMPITGAEAFVLFPEEFRRSLEFTDPLALIRSNLSVERPDIVLILYHGGLSEAQTLETSYRALLAERYGAAAPELFVAASHENTVQPPPRNGRRDRASYVDSPPRDRIEELHKESRLFVFGRGGNRIGRIVVARPFLAAAFRSRRALSVLRTEFRVFNYRVDPDHLGIRSRVLRYNEAFTAATGIKRDYEVHPAAAVGGEAPLTLDYFYSPNCTACRDFIKVLPVAAAAAGRSVRIAKRNIMEPKEFEALQGILTERGESFRLVPVLSGPGALLQGETAMDGPALEAFLRSGGTEAPPVQAGLQVVASPGGPDYGFRPSVAMVVAAGLLDGLNPCAFSTVLFLISTLSLLKIRRRRLAAVGLAFCTGVFAVYYAVGLGAAMVLRQSGSLPLLSRILRIAMAAFLTAAAGFSFYDALLAARGRTSAMVLQLPRGIKLKIHELVRSHRAGGAAAAGAFFLGATVSVLELGCTGQIYLPTLVYMARTQGGATDYFWLALYNGAFILPLLGVFGLAMGGCSSRRVGAFFADRLPVVKGATAVLFLVLAVLMVLS